jgi:hypothetical protein
MAVKIFRTGQTAERCKLFDVTGPGAAEVNFNAVPTLGGLDITGRNCPFYGVKTVVAGKAKRAC